MRLSLRVRAMGRVTSISSCTLPFLLSDPAALTNEGITEADGDVTVGQSDSYRSNRTTRGSVPFHLSLFPAAFVSCCDGMRPTSAHCSTGGSGRRVQTLQYDAMIRCDNPSIWMIENANDRFISQPISSCLYCEISLKHQFTIYSLHSVRIHILVGIVSYQRFRQPLAEL